MSNTSGNTAAPTSILHGSERGPSDADTRVNRPSQVADDPFEHCANVLYPPIVARVESQHPGLSADGWNAPSARPLTALGFATAIVFLHVCGFQRLPTPRGGSSSYTLKHLAETYGRATGLASYVSNGEMIAAALALAIPVGGPWGLNSTIGLRLPKKTMQ